VIADSIAWHNEGAKVSTNANLAEDKVQAPSPPGEPWRSLEEVALCLGTEPQVALLQAAEASHRSEDLIRVINALARNWSAAYPVCRMTL
jgi:hypothetical protein